jgi:hypothetical protein
MRSAILLLCLLVAAPARAQVQYRPADPPIVTAENDRWYVQGDPVQFAGAEYYRAGATVFFDGNRMVRTGHYNGVPLYADSSLEPYSVIFVPIGRGLMQPFERLRTGDLANTTPSRTPTFAAPARSQAAASVPAAPSAPTNAPLPPNVISGISQESGAVGTAGIVSPPRETARTGGVIVSPPARAARLTTPQAIRSHMWVEYLGYRWVSAGAAIPLTGSGLVQGGELSGVPVYTRGGVRDGVIYLQTHGGLEAPYRRQP